MQKEILKVVERRVREIMAEREGSHDYLHVKRVLSLSRRIAREEGADLFLVSLSALVHDLYDWKLYPQDHRERLEEFLEEVGIEERMRERVLQIVEEVSYRGENTTPTTLESRVLQDADRLDAMGAIGIARAFSYGGYRGRPIYNPAALPPPGVGSPHHPENFVRLPLEERLKWVEGVREGGSTLFHFYEKLLLLKEYMNTELGKKLAERRERFMVQFLEEFFREWEESFYED